jgi:hypothetical protein
MELKDVLSKLLHGSIPLCMRHQILVLRPGRPIPLVLPDPFGRSKCGETKK